MGRMNSEQEWETIRGDRGLRLGNAGIGMLRITLLFGSIAVALSLMVASMADNRLHSQVARGYDMRNIDMTTTGSIGSTERYTIRRSVLQNSPKSVCIIRENGSKSGDC